MEKAKEKWFRCIDDSFMSNEFKVAYKELLKNRFERIAQLFGLFKIIFSNKYHRIVYYIFYSKIILLILRE
jgi:hypothetical protein